MKMIISLAQFDVKLADTRSNFATVVDLVGEAAARGSHLVLLPELWSSGYDLENWRDYASPLGQGIYSQIASLAKDHHIWIGGTTLEIFSGRPYNTFTLYDSNGDLRAYYRKIHLFNLIAEDQWLGSGDHLVTVETHWGKIGLAICYDLRFPEIFRRYALEDVQLILLSAEWPASRNEHWRTLLQARAVENLFFVAATNRVGESREGIYGGLSTIIGPWGHRLVEGDSQVELLTREINFDDIQRARSKLSVLRDRRPEIYDSIVVSV